MTKKKEEKKKVIATTEVKLIDMLLRELPEPVVAQYDEERKACGGLNRTQYFIELWDRHYSSFLKIKYLADSKAKKLEDKAHKKIKEIEKRDKS
ncbi:MAG: hypothetical protein LC778_19830 [Acidobacteria bacterium]|nr:hypothetical protein [Acidobacteriota bacterium]